MYCPGRRNDQKVAPKVPIGLEAVGSKTSPLETTGSAFHSIVPTVGQAGLGAPHTSRRKMRRTIEFLDMGSHVDLFIAFVIFVN
jgi:hypothetical protein